MAAPPPRDTEAVRARLSTEDPTTGWLLGVLGLAIGALLGLLVCGGFGCLSTLF